MISGKVEDLRSAIIPGCLVVLESANKSYDKQEVNQEGQFNFIVAPGTYSIYLESPSIVSTRRADLHLAKGMKLNLVLRPLFTAPSDQSSIPAPKPQYRDIDASKRKFMLEYERLEKAEDGYYSYQGGPSVLSRGIFAVYADDFRCSIDLTVCKFHESSIIDLGLKEFNPKSATIDTTTGVVSMDLKTGKRVIRLW